MFERAVVLIHRKYPAAIALAACVFSSFEYAPCTLQTASKPFHRNAVRSIAGHVRFHDSFATNAARRQTRAKCVAVERHSQTPSIALFIDGETAPLSFIGLCIQALEKRGAVPIRRCYIDTSNGRETCDDAALDLSLEVVDAPKRLTMAGQKQTTDMRILWDIATIALNPELAAVAMGPEAQHVSAIAVATCRQVAAYNEIFDQMAIARDLDSSIPSVYVMVPNSRPVDGLQTPGVEFIACEESEKHG